MLASPTSRWSVGAAALAVLVLVASWFLLIGPRRADASSVREQAVSAQSQADALQTQIAQLKSQFGDLPKRRAELAAIKSQLPGTADVPALVRTLQDFASASGVSLDSLTPGTPLIYSAPGTAAAAAPATGTATAGQVVTIPLTMSTTGDYFEDALFIKSLQTKLDRAVLISGLTTTSTSVAAVTDSTTPSATATPTPTPSVTPTVVATAAATVSSTNLQITASIFVLLDDQTTLDEVADQAKTAAAAQATPATAASAA